MAINPKGLGSGTTLVGSGSGLVPIPDVAITAATGNNVVTSTEVTITFTWNLPVDGFTGTSAAVIFYDLEDAFPEMVGLSMGTGGDGDRIFTAVLNVPSTGSGSVDIVVGAGSATATEEPKGKGPPRDRRLTLRFDQDRSSTAPDVEISFPYHSPLSKRFVGERIVTRFSWTEDVGGFDLDDDVTLSNEDVTIGDLTGGPRVYDALIELPEAMGMTSITVTADSVRGLGTTGPPEDRSVTLLFDGRPTQNRGGDNDRTVPNPVLVHTDTKDLADGIYNGVPEMHIVGDKIYMVNQLMHNVGSSPNDFPNEARMAYGELAVYDIGDSAYSVLKEYEYITTAARSLVTHNSQLNFFEGSHYADIYNDNIDFIVKRDDQGNSFRQLQYTWKADAGFVRKVVDDKVEEVGTWRSAFRNPDDDAALRDIYYGRHIGTASPLVSGPSDTGEESVLSMVSGYGDLGNILDIDDPVSLYENWQWIQVGTRLNPRFDIVDTNDRTGWAILESMVTSTNSSIGFDVNKFFFRSANAPEAPVSEDTADYILDINADTLLQPIEDINFINAREIFYNHIRVQYGENIAPARDADSLHPESILEVRTLLSNQQFEWADWLARQYLARFSVLHQRINLFLIEHPEIKVGDIVFVKVEHRAHLNQACQVAEVTHDIDGRTTTLNLITID